MIFTTIYDYICWAIMLIVVAYFVFVGSVPEVTVQGGAVIGCVLGLEYVRKLAHELFDKMEEERARNLEEKKDPEK